MLNKHEQDLQVQAEEKAAEMALKVATATMEQIKAQLESDTEKLRAQLPSRLDETLECAKDVKYIRDRQQSLIQNMQGLADLM